MLSSCDYVDLKAYAADMRYILNTYIHADESKIISALANMSLVELLADGKNLTPDEVLREINCDDSAKPEIIENNITYEISQRMNTNAIYYYLNGDETLTLRVNEVIKASKERNFKENEQKTRRICRSIYSVLLEAGRERKRAKAETRELFEIVEVQPEYEQ